MEKIDKEKFIKDIEEDLGVKKHEDKIREEKQNEKNNSVDFGDLEKIFSEIFKETKKDYEPSALDIKRICKITKEEVKKEHEKIIEIKRKEFDKKENKFRNRKVKIKVKIPKEIKNEQQIIIYGEGNEDENLKRGNLLIKVIIKK